MAFLLVDILPLKAGKTIDEANAYFKDIHPILEKHGLKRTDSALEVADVLRGQSTAKMVNLFETDNPSMSLKGMGGDPDYQNHITVRDTIFDLENATILLTKRI